MLSNYMNLRMKEDSFLKSQRREYSLYQDKRIIGRIEEMKTSLELKNQLLNVINLHAVSSKHFVVRDVDGEVMAQLKKARGFNKDVEVFGADGSLLAVLKQKLGLKSQTILAQSPNGKTCAKAIGENDSLHLTVKDETNEVIATIHKKSTQGTLKDSLFSSGEYQLQHIKSPNSFDQITLIGMAVVLNDQLHNA
ncbi:hypothetical protein [Bacillus sp. RAR_GA_16]|uniref:hypothetical protein n=1 Tax=Bacillus sp. RAR_GA_16 TaxID=2876774 RepID=UPI001CCA1402|nr:hypothetical protein [Bacillus sp. RAR_GA_16]MCA0173857.1 hypothetical protein [Bacillus sp. RAR_GA_16]